MAPGDKCAFALFIMVLIHEAIVAVQTGFFAALHPIQNLDEPSADLNGCFK